MPVAIVRFIFETPRQQVQAPPVSLSAAGFGFAAALAARRRRLLTNHRSGGDQAVV